MAGLSERNTQGLRLPFNITDTVCSITESPQKVFFFEKKKIKTFFFSNFFVIKGKIFAKTIGLFLVTIEKKMMVSEIISVFKRFIFVFNFSVKLLEKIKKFKNMGRQSYTLKTRYQVFLCSKNDKKKSKKFGV